jgi:hypothetical protein
MCEMYEYVTQTGRFDKRHVLAIPWPGDEEAFDPLTRRRFELAAFAANPNKIRAACAKEGEEHG